jgi:hypothetical protein
MTLSRNDAIEQQLNAIEASLNSLTGASINEAWVLCPIATKRPDSVTAMAWLELCGVKAQTVCVLPHRSPNGRTDICFVTLPGFLGELPEPWMYVKYPNMAGDDVYAWTNILLNNNYKDWRQSWAKQHIFPS